MTQDQQGTRLRGSSATHLSARARLRAAFGGRRGTARLGVLVAAIAVLAGLTIGNGVAAHATKSGYEQAWLADGKRGQVVQVDPVRGKANVRLQVAQPGGNLQIEQGDGQLVIVDRTTGKVTSIDLGTLLTGGSRATPAGSNVKVLLAGQRMYLADLGRGSIQAVDPATEANIGKPWSAGTDLVDVGIDGQHQVWALDSTQRLVALRWNASGNSLEPVSTHALTGTGTGSVIIGHDRGVTVVGAHGTIARVGTGQDSTIHTGKVGGTLSAPQTSPRDLVPVADPGNSSVVIIGSSGAVSSPTSGLGCDHPGGPVVFDGKVYVPCLGAGLVVVLDSDGTQVRSPIHVPGGGDPQLTVSGGHLIVSAPGASSATVIDPVGSTHVIQTVDPRTPVQDPHQPPPSTPPNPPSPTQGTHGGHHDGGHRGGYGNGGGDGGGAPSGGTPTGGSHPGNSGGDGATASASARGDGTVLVQWQGPGAEGGYVITAGSSTDPAATVSGGADSATVTTLQTGTTTTLTVHAYDQHKRELWSATTAPVTVGGSAVSVSGLKYTSTPVAQGVALDVRWNAISPTAAGGSVSYQVTATGAGTTPKVTTGTSAQLLVTCSGTCSGTITVMPSTATGPGSATTVSYSAKAGTGTGTGTGGGGSTPPPSTPTTTPPPATVALPPEGQDMITSTQTAGNTEDGTDATVTITVTAPAQWAAWTDGTCSLIDNGGDLGVSVPCNANGWTYTLDYPAAGTHTLQIRATAHDGRIADSAGHTVTVRVIDTGCLNGSSQNVASSNFAGLPDRQICNPTCPPYPCSAIPFAAPQQATADAVIVRSTTRSYITLEPVSRRSGDAAPWGWAGLGAVALAALGGAEFLRRRARRGLS